MPVSFAAPRGGGSERLRRPGRPDRLHVPCDSRLPPACRLDPRLRGPAADRAWRPSAPASPRQGRRGGRRNSCDSDWKFCIRSLSMFDIDLPSPFTGAIGLSLSGPFSPLPLAPSISIAFPAPVMPASVVGISAAAASLGMIILPFCCLMTPPSSPVMSSVMAFSCVGVMLSPFFFSAWAERTPFRLFSRPSQNSSFSSSFSSSDTPRESRASSMPWISSASAWPWGSAPPFCDS